VGRNLAFFVPNFPQKYQLTIDIIVTFRIAALQPPRNEAQTQQSQFDAT
jgi:hypothetical protein